jgi:hemoglobin-like flavoprotein
MDRQIQIETSLALWAARVGDPAPRVYARLFARRPEYERLFALDRTGAARGNMLATALDAILDLAGPNAWGMNFILAERVNHQGVNVPPAEFLSFLHACLEVLREDLGADWTPDFEGAWSSVLAQIEAACAEDVG